MSLLRLAPLTVIAFSLPLAPVQAHHAFEPHFDSRRTLTIRGTVAVFERRNPHAYLHITADDGDGLGTTYRCESFGVTQLARNGLTDDVLKPGTRIEIDGVRHRRDPYMCYFNAVRLEDGREFDLRSPWQAGRSRVALRDSIYGTWLFSPNAWQSSSPPNSRLELTPAGIAAVLAYDPLKDDPAYRCEPVAPRRVWFAPGTPMSISREGDTIFLRFEWMDVVREVHLDQDSHPADGPRSLLGHSIGRFEGDTLVVETANFAPGVLRQYVEQQDGSYRGLLHSEAFTVTERIWFHAPSNSIRVVVDQQDPLYFTSAFNPSSGQFAASDLEIEPFGCIPEVLP